MTLPAHADVLQRLPAWARKGDPLSPRAHGLRLLLREQRLNTVCEEARCPNLSQCFSRGTATFMLLGDRCTRRCGYCSVQTARPLAADPEEPRRVAEAAARMRLRYVVLTSVARDDMADGGAAQFAATVTEVRQALPGARVEVLTPDFKGDRHALLAVLASGPDVFNHNIETVPRLFPEVRAQGSYARSLDLLAAARALRPGQVTKSGLMVGLGETDGEIVGVLEKRKAGFFGENEEDNAVFIPFRTAQKVAPARGYLLLIIRGRSGQVTEALTQAEEILRRRRNVKFGDPNNFDIKTADKFIEQFDSITAMVGLIAIAISSLGLLVGGIGVMNIMLVSVTERTKEIGVRKALGARRKDIVRQFLFEAMTLTFLGGILGVVLAVGISRIVMFFIPSLPASIPSWAVVTGLSVSIGVGLIFGVWPARKASRLDPIECLRYE